MPNNSGLVCPLPAGIMYVYEHSERSKQLKISHGSGHM
jgi:hypothetical protein